MVKTLQILFIFELIVTLREEINFTKAQTLVNATKQLYSWSLVNACYYVEQINW